MVTDDEVLQLMSRMDMNMDGELEFEEVVTALIDWDTLHTEELFGQAVDAVFAKLDKDGTGCLSSMELMPLLPSFLDNADDDTRELEVGRSPSPLLSRKAPGMGERQVWAASGLLPWSLGIHWVAGMRGRRLCAFLYYCQVQSCHSSCGSGWVPAADVPDWNPWLFCRRSA